MLKEKLEKIIKEPILGFKELDSGWYIVEREYQPESTRYNVAKIKELTGIKILFHDFKTGKSDSFTVSDNCKELANFTKQREVAQSVVLEHLLTQKLFDAGKRKDNGYLKKKGLEKFDTNKIKIKSIKDKNGKNVLLIPYTTFDLFPKFVGGKLITRTGTKFCVKGSKMKGAFHAHHFDKSLTTYFLGEGYAECFTALNLMANVNVLEVGMCSNMEIIIKQLPEDINIFVMGENDSRELYEKIDETYDNTKVVYPPDEKCKDFGDFFKKHGAFRTKKALLGSEFNQNSELYKPLGIQNNKPLVYSKVLNDVIEINPNNLDDTLRFCFDISTLGDIAANKKRMFANRLFLECAQLGAVAEHNRLPIGLWKNKDKYYYNDGQKILVVGKESLKLSTFENVATAEFLLCKVPGFKELNTSKKFNKQQELLNLFKACDFEHETYAKILIGFLVQSYYAGSIDFRPHLWFESLSPHSGKSWLSFWIKETLVKPSFGREAGISTPAGTTQGMQNIAGLLFCDEIAEKDSAYEKKNKQMIEILRSAATASQPIVLGTPEQVPKKLLIRFSTLLSCIEGKEFLKEQDYTRILFINFGKKKGGFERDVLPKLNAFKENGWGSGFGMHALKGFYMYKELYDKYLIKLTEEYPEIRHKARALASCIAGYGIYFRDEEAAEVLYKEVQSTPLIDSFESIVDDEDILETILRTIIPAKDFGSLEFDNLTLGQALKSSGAIDNYGIRYNDKQIIIYTKYFNNFVEKYFRQNKFYYFERIRKSKYYLKGSNSTLHGSKTKTIIFDYEL